MPSGQKMIGPDEKLFILDLHEKGRTAKQIAFETGRSENAIYRIIRTYAPTNQLAERLLKSRAEYMAAKVIRHGSTEELIDVLSRPNIGVLQPTQTRQSQTGIFLSINQASLGGVETIDVTQRQLTEGNNNGSNQGSDSGSSTQIEERSQESGSGVRKLHLASSPAVREAEAHRDERGPEESSAGDGAGTDAPRADGNAGRRRQRRKLLALDKDQPRAAIKRNAPPSSRNHGSSNIHLRYDI